jgi:hypothetical protein
MHLLGSSAFEDRHAMLVCAAILTERPELHKDGAISELSKFFDDSLFFFF